MKWLDATQDIKDEMDSTKSQIVNASSAYDLELDKNDQTRSAIADLHDIFFTMQNQKEEIIKKLGKLRDLVKIKNILGSSALVGIDKILKINLTPNTLEEREDTLMELESQHRMLAAAKKSWEEGKFSWKAILHKIQGSTSLG